MLDGMAQRSDLFNQQDLHVPRAPRPEGPVKQYDTNFLLKFQNMSNLKELPGFELPDLPVRELHMVVCGHGSGNGGVWYGSGNGGVWACCCVGMVVCGCCVTIVLVC